MELEDYTEFLQKPIESENKVLLFTFSFSTPKSGDANAYDRLLEVNIPAKWKFIQTENDMLIAIEGFDIIKFGRAGLKCKVTELEKELKILESAYDLCFGS